MYMGASSDLNFYSSCIILILHKWTIKNNNFEKNLYSILKMSCNLYWIIVQSVTSFIIRELSISSSAISIPVILTIIDISSFHCKPAHVKSGTNVGVSICLTITKTCCKNVFHYVGVPLIEFTKLKALSLAINSFTLCLKFLLNIPAVEVFLYDLSHCYIYLTTKLKFL